MRTADIDTSCAVWKYRPLSHKTAHHGHQRTIYIGPKAQEAIRSYLKPLNPDAFIFSPRDAIAERQERLAAARQTPMSCGNVPGSNRVLKPKRQPSNVYSVDAYRRAIARAADVADEWEKGGKVIANDERIIPRWHPHRLRHSAATEIRRQFGIEAAQTILGHASLSMTELYAEQNTEAGQRVAAAIG
jgi:integrase